jgi:hypothetical protein
MVIRLVFVVVECIESVSHDSDSSVTSVAVDVVDATVVVAELYALTRGGFSRKSRGVFVAAFSFAAVTFSFAVKV